MMDYCILTFPCLVPPDTYHSFSKTSNQLNKNRPVCSNLYTSYTSGTSKHMKNYDGLGKNNINQQQKETNQKLFLNKNIGPSNVTDGLKMKEGMPSRGIPKLRLFDVLEFGLGCLGHPHA